MESNTYKLKLQKVKGTWTTYLFVLGIGAFFLDWRLGVAIVLVGVAFTIKFKNDPDNNSALFYNYALTLYSKGDAKKAKDALNNAVYYRKDNKEAYFFLGCLYFDEKDYTNALTYLKRGGVDKVKDPSLTYVLGRCYYHTENYKEAIKYLTMITYEGNEYLENERLTALGYAACEAEEYELAYDSLSKVKIDLNEIKGDALEYCYYYGEACYYTDRDEEAKEYLGKVYEKDHYYKYIDVFSKEIEFN